MHTSELQRRPHEALKGLGNDFPQPSRYHDNQTVTLCRGILDERTTNLIKFNVLHVHLIFSNLLKIASSFARLD